MSVGETNTLRGLCFERGVEYRVVKNTLIRKALETLDTDYSSFDEVLKGFSGIMFHPESGKVPAQLIKEFKKKSGSDKLKFKGASVDSSVFVGESQLDVLIALKSKQEMIGEIIGLLQSPAKNVIGALQSGGNKLAGILKTLSEKED
jgi:large subunit ribosomal protein L10